MEYEDNVVDKLDITLQKHVISNLYNMRDELYKTGDELRQKIDQSVGQAVELFCKDVLLKPLYEIEKLPTRIENLLKQLKSETGVIPNIRNISRMNIKEFKDLFGKNNIRGLGDVGLEKIRKKLREYGVDFSE